MNPNIEVITPVLWAVNSQWIKAGWISELSPVLDQRETVNKYASLTDDGIMILKKESEFYPILKLLVPKIMQYSDEKLLSISQAIRFRETLDGYEKLYLNVMEWEAERRRIRADYLNHIPRPTWKIRIKKFLQKVGEKIGYYQHSD